MKVAHHAVISAAVSAGVWAGLNSPAAGLACFLTGVLLDIDHALDYVLNFGWRLRPSHFFSSFKYEAFDNIVVFLHSWEFIVVYLALLWFMNWEPVAIGAVVGILLHISLDHIFNAHSRLAYFLSYRLWHNFSAKHFYGAREYRKRLKRTRRQTTQ